MLLKNKTMDDERALFGITDITLEGCIFDGPADGESALKECEEIKASECIFRLRYPFWHDRNVKIDNCEMTESCRAALWYSSNINISNTLMHGIKALRECESIEIMNCNIKSPEFGWFSSDITVADTVADGEYMLLKSKNVTAKSFSMKGKYSFQYIENATFDSCVLDTKDAFWHAKNVTVKNSVVKGEYLAWYAENLTFENCKIYGTQPLCYCKGLKLINCEMHECDLAFEKSEVEAEITTPVISIKNPASGRITLPAVGEIIDLNPDSSCEIIFE